MGAVARVALVSLACCLIAGPALGKSLAAMAPGGRWIVIATLGGAMSEINVNTFFRRGIKLIGSTLAMSGAYQMHLAIKSKAGGGVDPHAGHSH